MAGAAAGWRSLMWRGALTAAAVLVAVALARAGIADVWFLSVKAHFGASPLSEDRIDLILARLEPAVQMDPQNPVFRGALGDIDYRRASYAEDDLGQRLAYFEKAREHYLAAAALQPNEGDRWADLIYTYGDLIDVKQKLAASAAQPAADPTTDLLGLKQALQIGSRLAPWSSYMLDAVTETIEQHLGLLGPVERQIFAEAQARAVEKKRRRSR